MIHAADTNTVIRNPKTKSPIPRAVLADDATGSVFAVVGYRVAATGRPRHATAKQLGRGATVPEDSELLAAEVRDFEIFDRKTLRVVARFSAEKPSRN